MKKLGYIFLIAFAFSCTKVENPNSEVTNACTGKDCDQLIGKFTTTEAMVPSNLKDYKLRIYYQKESSGFFNFNSSTLLNANIPISQDGIFDFKFKMLEDHNYVLYMYKNGKEIHSDNINDSITTKNYILAEFNKVKLNLDNLIIPKKTRVLEVVIAPLKLNRYFAINNKSSFLLNKADYEYFDSTQLKNPIQPIIFDKISGMSYNITVLFYFKHSNKMDSASIPISYIGTSDSLDVLNIK